jgi:single-stranded-DNA-specific exonuclease
VGIVAARLKDRYHRPAIVFARGSDGALRGSGRSIAGFHLRDALDLIAKRAPRTIDRFGGHAYAAGLTLAESALPRFAAVFEEVAREQLTPAQLRQTFETDGSLGEGELDWDLVTTLRERVWGQGFPAPVFDDTFTVVEQRVVGEQHARLVLERCGERFAAIAFRQTQSLPPRIHAVYRPDVNLWNGRESIELVLELWQTA